MVEAIAVPFVPEPVVSIGLVLCLESELGYVPLGDSQASHKWLKMAYHRKQHDHRRIRRV